MKKTLFLIFILFLLCVFAGSQSSNASYSLTSLNYLDDVLTFASGIDSNNIAGYYKDASGNYQGFLATQDVSSVSPLTIGSSSLSEGEVGLDYNASLQISGGNPPYFLSIIKSSLPSGLSLSPEGIIAGTPSKAETKSFTVQAADYVGSSVCRKFKIKILEALSITTKNLIKGRAGKYYKETLNVKGGIPPFSWSLVSKNLPNGLIIDSLSGRITGTPNMAGNSDFTVKVTDSFGASAFKALTLVVKPLLHASWELGPAVYYDVNNLAVGQTAIGDLNGDGRMDIAIAPEACGRNVLVYYQDTFGELSSPNIIDKPDICLRRIAIGDLNGDGKDDLSISGTSNFALSGWLGRVLIFFQNPVSGVLMPPQEYIVSSNGVNNLQIGDLNSDGLNDLIILIDGTYNPMIGRIAIFYQQFDNTLAPETIFNHVPVKIYHEMHLADMNNDGSIDIVLQSRDTEFAVIKQDLSTNPPTLSSKPEYYSVDTSYWTTFYAFATGDLNGDGRNDVVVLDPGNCGYLSIFLQNSLGTLDQPIILQHFPETSNGIEIADINGDGLNDMLFDRAGCVLVMYQNTDHTFQPPIPYPFPALSSGGSPEHEALSVGDVTGDGRPDAVVTRHDEGLFVLPNVCK